jgi:starch synthase
LAARLNQMLEDPAACKRFGEAGRKRVEDIFSWTAIAQQTIQLYQSLIARLKSGN